MLVFIGKLSLGSLRWLPICQGFSHFTGFPSFLFWPKLATSSTSVNAFTPDVWKLVSSLLIFLSLSSVCWGCRTHRQPASGYSPPPHPLSKHVWHIMFVQSILEYFEYCHSQLLGWCNTCIHRWDTVLSIRVLELGFLAWTKNLP